MRSADSNQDQQHRVAVKAALAQLQNALVAAKHWSDTRPSQQALNSRQPFCVDTLGVDQWLQFVFIPKMTTLIEAQQALPAFAQGQGISPMAEEFFKSDNAKPVLEAIRSIDNLLVAK